MVDEAELRTDLCNIFGGLDTVSEDCVDFHAKFWDDLGEEYKSIARNVENAIEGYRRDNRYYNDHGKGHSYRITDALGKIDKELYRSLDTGEAFILCCSAWLHDIGMAIEQKIPVEDLHPDHEEEEWFPLITAKRGDTKTIEAVDDKSKGDIIRDWHHILSWYFIRHNWEEIGIPNKQTADEIAEITRVHRRKVKTGFDRSQYELRIGQKTYKIPRGSIAAIFQFADALDTDERRAKQDERKYVLDLPEEAQRHWDVCELINTYDINLTSGEITFRAEHDGEESADLIRWKMAELYDEYESISRVLTDEPYPFVIRSITCASYHSADSSKKLDIDGRKEYNKKTVEREKRITDEQADSFSEKKSIFEVVILNKQGDAEVTRKIQMESVDEGLAKRTHFVRSLDNGMHWDWSRDIIARDEYGNKLEVEMKRDRPTQKEFDVIFSDEIDKHEFYTYEYQYNWDEYFPEVEEVFFTKAKADVLQFEFDFPTTFEISDIKCSGRYKEEFEEMDVEFESDAENHYSATVETGKSNPTIQIEWVNETLIGGGTGG